MFIIEVRARRVHMEVRALQICRFVHYLIMALFIITPRGYGRELKVWVLVRVHTTGAIMSSCKLEVVMGSGLPEELEWSRAWFFLSKSNARTISLSSATSGETAWVEEFVLTLATTALARV
ncbi:hypothetical protein Tco_1203371 [Tanacetum coccineum]|uniref:Uncharacterized protein n=1 Tax=Tanacetum coccineum TaxID=301880 RepID=A0ABQ4WWT8_9ASTR